MATRTLFGYIPSTHCGNCGRLLTDPVSVNRGIGPICWEKEFEEMNNNDNDNQAPCYLFEYSDVEKHGIVLERRLFEVNTAWTNVPRLVTHHSPSGFEWGYPGSGPADLSLNIVQLALTKLGYTGAVIDCYYGLCFTVAFLIHQDFKREFIANADHYGKVIPWSVVTAWVAYYTTQAEKAVI